MAGQVPVQPVVGSGGEAVKVVERKKGKVSGKAAWKRGLPGKRQALQSVPGEGVMVTALWGDGDRRRLAPHRGSAQVKVPSDSRFGAFLNDVVMDFLLSARADGTRRAYKAWVECFVAWMSVFGLDMQVSDGCWVAWVDVLIASMATLALSYSAATVTVYVSAVSCYMQDRGLPSPSASRKFKMVFEGVQRWLGQGKHKKPGVLAAHVAAILDIGKPRTMSFMQYEQALAVLLVGWHLFCRSQDFLEFQVCDFREEVVNGVAGMRVLVRKAKNDQKGFTRDPFVGQAASGVECPVRRYRQYVKAVGLQVMAGCTKQWGKPDRCEVCAPAFPSITKHQGRKDRPMPKSRVTAIIKELFMHLAEQGHMDAEEASQYSSKSLRCGGVSEASALAVRDGVLQGHGGWLSRQSLIHYDGIQESERHVVSGALNEAVEAWRLGCTSTRRRD